MSADLYLGGGKRNRVVVVDAHRGIGKPCELLRREHMHSRMLARRASGPHGAARRP